MTIPTTVSNLRITSGSSRPVVLEWDAIDTATHGPVTYSIQRKLATATTWPARIGSTANTTYTDSTASAGVTYDYRVYFSFGLAAEPVRVVALGTDPTYGPYIDVERTTSSITGLFAHSHKAGEPISCDAGSSWLRPFGALSGTWNGKGVPDVGIANGFKDRTNDWAYGGSTPTHGNYRGGYFGHPDYEALYGPQWPIDTYDSSSQAAGRVYYDTYDGNEFWLQFRMKVNAGKFESSPTGVPASASKLFYLQTCNGSSACQIYFNVKPSTRGRLIECQHDGQVAIGSVNIPLADNGVPWECPVDEWTTYMLHIKPGHTNTAANEDPDGTLEVFAQKPGDTQWRTLYSNTAFPFRFSFPPDWNRTPPETANPPGYNSFSPRNYPNHYVGSSSSGACPATNAVICTQIILSSQPIPLPLFPA